MGRFIAGFTINRGQFLAAGFHGPMKLRETDWERPERRALWESSQATQPQLEDGSVYRQNRPIQLDKIKNLHLDLRFGSVGRRRSYPSSEVF